MNTTCSKYNPGFLRVLPYAQHSLIKAHFVNYTKKLKNNKTVAVLKNEFMVAFKPPTPGAFTTDEGYVLLVIPSFLVTWILQVN